MSNVTLILLWEGIVDTVEVNDNLNEITPLMTYQQQSKKGLNNIAWTKLCYLSAEQWVILLIADMKSNVDDLCVLCSGSEPRFWWFLCSTRHWDNIADIWLLKCISHTLLLAVPGLTCVPNSDVGFFFAETLTHYGTFKTWRQPRHNAHKIQIYAHNFLLPKAYDRSWPDN